MECDDKVGVGDGGEGGMGRAVGYEGGGVREEGLWGRGQGASYREGVDDC